LKTPKLSLNPRELNFYRANRAVDELMPTFKLPTNECKWLTFLSDDIQSSHNFLGFQILEEQRF
jgi:hypothetical protein